MGGRTVGPHAFSRPQRVEVRAAPALRWQVGVLGQSGCLVAAHTAYGGADGAPQAHPYSIAGMPGTSQMVPLRTAAISGIASMVWDRL